MKTKRLIIQRKPTLRAPSLLLGLSGWMDSGNVSTGTVNYFVEKYQAVKFAHIEPEGLYIYNFPSPMEISAMFRPHTKIRNGIVKSIELPKNIFYGDEENDLILFRGKEPNMNWTEYAESIFTICGQFNVEKVIFIGSVAGLAPHTREPRIYCTVSDSSLKTTLEQSGIKYSTYEGPASIVTHLLYAARRRSLKMMSLVAEVPAYLQGYNPRAIEAAIKRLVGILGLGIQIDEFRSVGDEFERRVSDVVQNQDELSKIIHQLETDYDNEVFDTGMSDLKIWLEQQGIRVD